MLTRIALLALSGLLAGLLTGCGIKERDANKPTLGARAKDRAAAAMLGYPSFATKNTTRIGGADAIANATGVAMATYPAQSPQTRPGSVTLVSDGDWRVAISAAQLSAAPLRSPILFFSSGKGKGKLPGATAAALDQLAPTGRTTAAATQVIRIGPGPTTKKLRTFVLWSGGYASTAAEIDRLSIDARGRPSRSVVIASSERPEFAMPAAAWAAKSGDPVLWVDSKTVPAATAKALEQHRGAKIYVLGPTAVITDAVVNELRKFGDVQRVSGNDPVTNSVAFARFVDGDFGWNIVNPGHGLVFASSASPNDAAAAALLSSTGQYGPLLLVNDAGRLSPALHSYLLDIQPGYQTDPTRGVYNHGWIVGDQRALSTRVQAEIDSLLEIKAVDTSVR